MRLHMILTLGSLPLLGAALPAAHAACAFSPGPGNDSFVCDSGTADALVDTEGDNSLVLPAGGTGAITGNVTFGPGRDRIDMASGSIGGNVNQGAGIDDFVMSGGVIEGNLNQGDGLDTFYMNGGWIKGTFDSGDYAEMDAGRIGNVNMRLDKNTFIMRGGSVDRNVITAFDTDYIEIFEGTIGGNISVSGGDDQVLIHGGEVGGDVLLSTGNDRFVWDGGRIGGKVDAGPGDDTALLSGLGPDALVITLDGGEGNDSLTFNGSQAVGGASYVNWERVALTNSSSLELDDTLVLGDATSNTGSLNLDSSSTLSSRQGVITAFGPGQRASVNNAGTLNLGGGNDALGRLTIEGDYTGENGLLRLNSVLAGDNAASDRLVVSGGAIAGSTRLLVNNLGGAGAATAQNGIQVVEAREGATSTPTAFVQTQTLSAGAYDYRLFKGGGTAGSENSWYLRSTLVAPPVIAPPSPPTEVPEQPGTPPVVTPPVAAPVTPPVAAPAPGQPDLPTPVQGTESLPLYRPEVPVYAAAPRGAAIIARQALGTFHQRQGDQQLMGGEGALPAAWGQAYGGTLRQQWSGTVNPSLDGDLYGFKVGQDLYATVSERGYRQQVGVYVSHARLTADVKGFALAQQDRRVGDLRLDGDSVGAYWTLVGPQGGYVDAVVQYTRLDGRARSDRGDALDIDGHAWTGSVESGYPIALSDRWTLEPQAQLIAQKVQLDTASDSVARVSHDAQVELTGRVGLRLEGAFKGSSGRLLQPYAQVNLWHGDGGRDTLVFDDIEKIKTDYRYTSVQVESGVVAQINQALSLHGGVQYTSNLDSRQQQASGVNLGVRWQF